MVLPLDEVGARAALGLALSANIPPEEGGRVTAVLGLEAVLLAGRRLEPDEVVPVLALVAAEVSQVQRGVRVLVVFGCVREVDVWRRDRDGGALRASGFAGHNGSDVPVVAPRTLARVDSGNRVRGRAVEIEVGLGAEAVIASEVSRGAVAAVAHLVGRGLGGVEVVRDRNDLDAVAAAG